MITQGIHWLAFSYYAYLFGYASLYKIFQRQEMMDGMESLGFNKTWTLCIGFGELIGIIALFAGLWNHHLKNAAVIYLLLFAVGALMVHFAHKDYEDFYDALFGAIAAVILLITDKHFKVIL
jgi:FtsH-binding integral membrane protein